MILERYRQMLPPYWYENDVAEYHFEGAGGESEYQSAAIQELGSQFLVPYATYGLDVWDWIYFGDTQLGSDEQRRAAIRKKSLAKSRFTLATLQTLGNMAGTLKLVEEDYLKKEIVFHFELNEIVMNLGRLAEDFEAIRPVHVNKQRVSLELPTKPLTITDKVMVNTLRYHTVGEFKVGMAPLKYKNEVEL
ncbi:hypothetical protein ACTID9_17730 [Brevibacillus fluminis]|uniref:hypothetical protein n=1 Tax=Brevibacillus fluminis TaxID=511487 RepID=UPI003F889495